MRADLDVIKGDSATKGGDIDGIRRGDFGLQEYSV
jgi:hypothetical protein